MRIPFDLFVDRTTVDETRDFSWLRTTEIGLAYSDVVRPLIEIGGSCTRSKEEYPHCIIDVTCMTKCFVYSVTRRIQVHARRFIVYCLDRVSFQQHCLHIAMADSRMLTFESALQKEASRASIAACLPSCHAPISAACAVVSSPLADHVYIPSMQCPKCLCDPVPDRFAARYSLWYPIFCSILS